MLLRKIKHYKQKAQEMGPCQAGRAVLGRAVRTPHQYIQKKLLLYRLECMVNSVKIQQLNVNPLRLKTLSFVESMRVQGKPTGRYRYSKSQRIPVLYASAYAALTRHLYRDLHTLTDVEKEEWIFYINTFQCDDGLFRDAAVQNDIAESEDWWGWRHLSAHVVTALTVLGGKPRYPFRFLDFLCKPGEAYRWLSRLPWREKPSFVSNTIMNYGLLLQYSRDFHGNRAAATAMEEIFALLDETQDPATGLWGNLPPKTPCELALAERTAYHLWNLYFYDKRPIHYLERAIDSCLAIQNKLGGYGFPVNTSACEDIDSIDPLSRFYFLTDYRREDIKKSLERALRWVLVNQMDDGGFVFSRFEGFVYGHELMTTGPEESHLFGTWFRTLSIAYVSQILYLPEFPADTWCWIKCPGYQFWHGVD